MLDCVIVQGPLDFPWQHKITVFAEFQMIILNSPFPKTVPRTGPDVFDRSSGFQLAKFDKNPGDMYHVAVGQMVPHASSGI